VGEKGEERGWFPKGLDTKWWRSLEGEKAHFPFRGRTISPHAKGMGDGSDEKKGGGGKGGGDLKPPPKTA